jgi:hypothetical protein
MGRVSPHLGDKYLPQMLVGFGVSGVLVVKIGRRPIGGERKRGGACPPACRAGGAARAVFVYIR